MCKALDLAADCSKGYMGVRSARFSAIVEYGVVTHVNVEPDAAPGALSVSGAYTVLRTLVGSGHGGHSGGHVSGHGGSGGGGGHHGDGGHGDDGHGDDHGASTHAGAATGTGAGPRPSSAAASGGGSGQDASEVCPVHRATNDGSGSDACPHDGLCLVRAESAKQLQEGAGSSAAPGGSAAAPSGAAAVIDDVRVDVA